MITNLRMQLFEALAATQPRSPQREEDEAVLVWPRPGLQPPGSHQHRGHGEHGGQAAHPHQGREDAEDVEGGDVEPPLLGPPDHSYLMLMTVLLTPTSS